MSGRGSPFGLEDAAGWLNDLATDQDGSRLMSALWGPYWAPVALDGGRPCRGADRLVLAASAAASGTVDARWADIACLVRSGLLPRAGELATVLPDGRVLYHAGQLEAIEGTGRGLPAGDGGRTADDIGETLARLVGDGGVTCAWRGVRRPAFDQDTGTVLVPVASRWGRTASDLRELVAEMVRAAMVGRDGARDAIVMRLATAFACADLGLTEVEDARKRPNVADEELHIWEEVSSDADSLLACAEEAEEVTARTIGHAIDVPDGNGDEAPTTPMTDSRHERRPADEAEGNAPRKTSPTQSYTLAGFVRAARSTDAASGQRPAKRRWGS